MRAHYIWFRELYVVIKFRELVDGEYKKDVSEECGVKRPPKQRERLESAQLGDDLVLTFDLLKVKLG